MHQHQMDSNERGANHSLTTVLPKHISILQQEYSCILYYKLSCDIEKKVSS